MKTFTFLLLSFFICHTLYSQEKIMGGSTAKMEVNKSSIPNYKLIQSLKNLHNDSIASRTGQAVLASIQAGSHKIMSFTPSNKNPNLPINWHASKDINLLATKDSLVYFLNVSDTIKTLHFGTSFKSKETKQIEISYESSSKVNISVSIFDNSLSKFVVKRESVLPPGLNDSYSIPIDDIDTDSMILLDFYKSALGGFSLYSINLNR
ncbi:MAG: hypothetical protein JEZ14_09025 [Marinilabiliaceae bacterium]|nr:hypothetical protein [Marinilabiliaceae bacterium]